jgi:pyruvate kinase
VSSFWGALHRSLAPERIVNGTVADETGGVYIAATRYMYRFDADADGSPSITWKEPYDAGTHLKAGQVDIGTGTTPTLMGEDYVAISDNAEPRMHVVVWRRAKNVQELQRRLAELGGDRLGIVLKIETLEAFEHLPELLLAAMRSPAAGVMIARGDLAVECGYERMAEVQEEILWFCEAAHMPVIWATQVLEKLAKKGLPSRAEITDAAMGVRAECVMLNKGPYIIDAVRTLDDILERMQDHQWKKRSMLRQLRLARNLQA